MGRLYKACLERNLKSCFVLGVVTEKYSVALREIISKDEFFMDLLQCVRSLQLPQWYIGAGVVRSLVWDTLHHYQVKTQLSDVDVAYYDLTNIDLSCDDEIRKKLCKLRSGVNWDVFNQARAHLMTGESVVSCEEAVSTWPETATCVGVRLEENGDITLYAPYGLTDLFELKLRKGPVSYELFESRVKEKRWLEKWPKLKLV